MASQKASIAHFLNKVAPKYVRDHVFYFNIQQLHLTLTLTQSFPTWATRNPRDYFTEVPKKCVNKEKLALKGKFGVFHIAQLQTILQVGSQTRHKLKTCDELRSRLIRAFLDYAWGTRQQKRSGSFQLILTKSIKTSLNATCKPNSDPKANPKSNKKKKVKSCLLN